MGLECYDMSGIMGGNGFLSHWNPINTRGIQPSSFIPVGTAPQRLSNSQPGSQDSRNPAIGSQARKPAYPQPPAPSSSQSLSSGAIDQLPREPTIGSEMRNQA
jgi:hypothetical protein